MRSFRLSSKKGNQSKKTLREEKYSAVYVIYLSIYLSIYITAPFIASSTLLESVYRINSKYIYIYIYICMYVYIYIYIYIHIK